MSFLISHRNNVALELTHKKIKYEAISSIFVIMNDIALLFASPTLQ